MCVVDVEETLASADARDGGRCCGHQRAEQSLVDEGEDGVVSRGRQGGDGGQPQLSCRRLLSGRFSLIFLLHRRRVVGEDWQLSRRCLTRYFAVLVERRVVG